MTPFMLGKNLSSLSSRLHRQHRTMSTGGDGDCDGGDGGLDMLPHALLARIMRQLVFDQQGTTFVTSILVANYD
jgi:hypothetical protein